MLGLERRREVKRRQRFEVKAERIHGVCQKERVGQKVRGSETQTRVGTVCLKVEIQPVVKGEIG